jgi:pimeloyl-ACP methyl ester carboxylesterase
VKLTRMVWGDPRSDRIAVCLHGITSNAGSWSRVAAELRNRGLAVVAPDLRGHGGSPKPVEGYGLDDLLHDLADSCEQAPELLIGHSFGGTLAILAAAESIIRPRTLVLLDPVISLTDRRQAERTIRAEREDTSQTIGELARTSPRWAPEELANKILSRHQVYFAGAGAAFAGNVPWDLWGRLVGISASTNVLCVFPEESPYSSRAQIRSLRNAIGSERCIQLPGSGHSVHRDDLAGVMRAIDGVLGRSSATASVIGAATSTSHGETEQWNQ